MQTPDHVDRAAEVIERVIGNVSDVDAIAQALDSAGLLVTPAERILRRVEEGDAEPHEPCAWPCRSQGVERIASLVADRERAAAARALREAGESIADTDGTEWPYDPVIDWLHDRADRIEADAEAANALRDASLNVPRLADGSRPDPLPGLPEARDLLAALREAGWAVVREDER